jgi:hypothetical protein
MQASENLQPLGGENTLEVLPFLAIFACFLSAIFAIKGFFSLFAAGSLPSKSF